MINELKEDKMTTETQCLIVVSRVHFTTFNFGITTIFHIRFRLQRISRFYLNVMRVTNLPINHYQFYQGLCL